MTRTVPTYRSSAALTALAQRIYGIHHNYMTKRTSDENRINYTPDGRAEVRARDAREAFTQLHLLLGEARREGERVVAEARSKATAALREVAPNLDAASAIIAVEVARMFQQDQSQRARLVNVAAQQALDPADAEVAALVIHLPSRLSGLTAEQRDTLRVALVPSEAIALYTAKDEAEQIIRHAGTVAGMVAEHAQHWDMSTDLTIAVGDARSAQAIGRVEPKASLDGEAVAQPKPAVEQPEPEEVE